MSALMHPLFALSKRAIKTGVRLAGYEILRRHPVETSLLRRTLREVLDHSKQRDFSPSTIIDVGVGTGTPGLYDVFPQAVLLLVEPLTEFAKEVEDLHRRYGGHYILAAAGRESGSAVLNVHVDHLEGSSILREFEGEHVDGSPRQVPVVTLDEVCAAKELRGPFVLKVDAQGAELEVLEGAQKVLLGTELLVLETSLFRFMRDGPDLYEVLTYMKARGFVVYDIFGGRNRPLDGALAQVDMAFVKEEGIFHQNRSYATIDQRRLMGFRV